MGLTVPQFRQLMEDTQEERERDARKKIKQREAAEDEHYEILAEDLMSGQVRGASFRRA